MSASADSEEIAGRLTYLRLHGRNAANWWRPKHREDCRRAANRKRANQRARNALPSDERQRDNRKPQRLRLSVQDRELILDEQFPQAAIGRADDNDIVIRGNLISRLHARIEFSRNRFTLTDQSTNGTFVQIAGEEEAFVRRDSISIKGEGLIGLGRVPDADSPLTIRFVCEDC